MGVKRLWTHVQTAGVNVGLGDYRGHRVGIDAYSWIYGQLDICVGTHKCIQDAIVKRARRLRKSNITSIFVFDGADVPVKAEAIEKRRARRLRRALAVIDRHSDGGGGEDEDASPPLPPASTLSLSALMSRGILSTSDALLRSARLNFEVTCDHAKIVVDALRAADFECLVAPYEADAQLAYLCSLNYINHVMTEDSDALVFGCPSVIRGGGGCAKGALDGDYVTPSGVPSHYMAYTQRRTLDVLQCTPAQLVLATAGGGSDYYVSGARGVALSKSLHVARTADSAEEFIAEVVAITAMTPEEEGVFATQFYRALHCYNRHIVYDPIAKVCTTLHPAPCLVSHATAPCIHAGVALEFPERDVVGTVHSPDVARQVCEDVTHHPCTLKPYDPSHRQLALSRTPIAECFVSKSGTPKPLSRMA